MMDVKYNSPNQRRRRRGRGEGEGGGEGWEGVGGLFRVVVYAGVGVVYQQATDD